MDKRTTYSYIILEVRDKKGVKRKNVTLHMEWCYERNRYEKIVWKSENKKFKIGNIVLLDTMTMEVIKVDENDFIYDYLDNKNQYICNLWRIDNRLIEEYFIIDFFHFYREDKHFHIASIEFFYEREKFFLEVQFWLKDFFAFSKEIDLNFKYRRYSIMYFSLEREKLYQVKDILGKLTLKYPDVIQISKLLPIGRGKDNLKRKLMGKPSIYGIKGLSILYGGSIDFYLDKGEEINGCLERMLDSELKVLATKEDEYDIDIDCVQMCKDTDLYAGVVRKFYGKEKCAIVDVSEILNFIENHMSFGTMYDMMCNVLDYLEKYPIVIDEIYREDIGDDSNVYNE